MYPYQISTCTNKPHLFSEFPFNKSNIESGPSLTLQLAVKFQDMAYCIATLTIGRSCGVKPQGLTSKTIVETIAGDANATQSSTIVTPSGARQ
jgi:hypothetical protein